MCEANEERSGTGSSCIYPLLGCKLRNGWRFGATGRQDFLRIGLGHGVRTEGTSDKLTRTDIDQKSLQFARRNLAKNGFEKRVRLLETSSDGPLIPLDALGLERYAFPLRTAVRSTSASFFSPLPIWKPTTSSSGISPLFVRLANHSLPIVLILQCAILPSTPQIPISLPLLHKNRGLRILPALVLKSKW